jgi:DMSO/TMAO reductase YedYZ heme-binding membrane subunit
MFAVRPRLLRLFVVWSMVLFLTAVAIWLPWQNQQGYTAALFVLVVLASAAYRVLLLWRTQRKRNRELAGLCLICGYDLRATPGRCPECGSPAGPAI